MSDPPRQVYTPPPIEDGAELLRRIGWHPSDMKQIELYAHMSPARKVEQMFRERHEYILELKEHLRREHPGYSRIELAHMLGELLDLEREYPHVQLSGRSSQADGVVQT